MADKYSPFDAALQAEGADGKLAALARSIFHQESGSGANAKTSNAGAMGGMQVIPSTFTQVADAGWDMKDPLANARAGIRYLKSGLEASGGDPALAAAFYYGGPGGMAKAQRGIAVSDPRNPNAPNTLQYAQQVVNRMPKDTSMEAVIRAVGASPLNRTMDQEEVNGPIGEYPQGALSQIDPANPWGMNDAVGNYGAAEPQPAQPAQPQPGALTRAHAAPDMQAMLAQYMPQDNSQSKYLALAAGFGAATKTGSFGESLGNVASALQDQKAQQEKLRSQYVPLIMQQVAAQQARDEQAQYRAEAQQTAIAAQKEAAKLLAENRAYNDEQNRLTRESIAADRLAAAQAAKDAKPDPIPHVVTTPDGVFTLGRDGKPVRMNDPATGLPLTGKETSDIPKLKPGEKWNPDTQKAEAIVGSDLYQKQASAHSKDYAALSSVNTQMDSSIGKVNEILDPKKTDAFNSNFGGYNALITQYLPGDAADMKKRIEGVKSDLKMAGLNMMRAGGGIGAMTEKEWPIVEAMVAKIDPRLSEEEARLEFGKVIAYMSRIKENANTTYGMEWADSPHSRKTLGAAPASSAMPSQGGPTPVQSLVDKYRSK